MSRKIAVVAIIRKHRIYHVDDASLISIATPSSKIERRPFEQRYIDTFLSVDLRRDFYFSYAYDITRSLQSNMTSGFECGINEMFCWNYFLLSPILTSSTVKSPWMLPLIHGFIEQSSN